MKRVDRRQAIMDQLVSDGAVNLDDLVHRFAVSRMTIHRDLDDLETAGVLRKIRGGATIEAGTQFESDFRFRVQQSGDANVKMANAALELVEPGMTIMINDGSMSAVLGACLVEKRPLTVITNNAAIIDTLKSESGITLISLGGEYSAKFNGFFGIVTEAALSTLRADVVFVSSPAVNGTEVFHMNDSVVRTKRAMIKAGSKTCLLIHHTRFGHTALHKLADLSDFDIIITDSEPEEDYLALFPQAGLSLTVAD
jgi:DeoR/GlpR family transcriptional regulator of sugar metabolism